MLREVMKFKEVHFCAHLLKEDQPCFPNTVIESWHFPMALPLVSVSDHIQSSLYEVKQARRILNFSARDALKRLSFVMKSTVQEPKRPHKKIPILSNFDQDHS
jgi:hypothetical protein